MVLVLTFLYVQYAIKCIGMSLWLSTNTHSIIWDNSVYKAGKRSLCKMFLLLSLQSDSDLVSLLLYLILLTFLFCKNVQHFKRKVHICMKVPVVGSYKFWCCLQNKLILFHWCIMDLITLSVATELSSSLYYKFNLLI